MQRPIKFRQRDSRGPRQDSRNRPETLGGSLDQIEIDIIAELLGIFKNDTAKVYYWLRTSNPNFGGSTPLGLIRGGRAKRILEFIESVAEAD